MMYLALTLMVGYSAIWLKYSVPRQYSQKKVQELNYVEAKEIFGDDFNKNIRYKRITKLIYLVEANGFFIEKKILDSEVTYNY